MSKEAWPPSSSIVSSQRASYEKCTPIRVPTCRRILTSHGANQCASSEHSVWRQQLLHRLYCPLDFPTRSWTWSRGGDDDQAFACHDCSSVDWYSRSQPPVDEQVWQKVPLLGLATDRLLCPYVLRIRRDPRVPNPHVGQSGWPSALRTRCARYWIPRGMVSRGKDGHTVKVLRDYWVARESLLPLQQLAYVSPQN